MTFPPPEAHGPNLARAGLAACAVGLVLTPFGYLAIGALRGFDPAFGRLAVPLLLLATGYVLHGLLSVPGTRSWGWRRIAGTAVGGILIGGFLVVVSGYTLLTTTERIGLTATLFLVATLVALPLVTLRPTAVRAGLARVPGPVALVLLLGVLGGAGVAVAVYLLRGPAFL